MYAVRIARNLAVHVGHRAARNKRAHIRPDATTSARTDVSPLLAMIDEAIARLPNAQRVVFVMHDVEGFTHSEIAAKLGLSEQEARASLRRAGSALRESLGTALEEHAERRHIKE